MTEQGATVLSSSRQETLHLGTQLATELAGGDVVLLRGPLGAGKTVFAAGIATGLGSSTWRGSPTFALVNEYATRPPLYHVDLYRLSEEQTEDFGLEEYARWDSIVVCEWPERAPRLLQSLVHNRLFDVDLEYVDDQHRQVTVRVLTQATTT